MRTRYLPVLFAFASAGALAHDTATSVAEPNNINHLREQAQSLTQQFVSQLKPQLKAALQQGGPVNAIEVCADVAPQITQQLSTDSGWAIKRVSLNTRNPAATPDQWEKTQLLDFEKRLESGDAAKALNAEIIDNGNYRFMQAQVTGGVCLTCHGTNLAPAVTSALQHHYPNDQATGYELGAIRGAISLSKHLGQTNTSATRQH
ncbi:Uncharacterised protein [BD1-7 clade bacterium]|uniref:Tll0287-like domain-containing protein n=1 Tax=BD1-7 clade bacterium TaxID=2029982 RepID=A0A5S9QRN9_9GAMM|nr:Uncharacterised protein [BD1-7 clade bacterium]CAA0122060.1 Uncharacterised protein [BD1-7 clade bacterium]